MKGFFSGFVLFSLVLFLKKKERKYPELVFLPIYLQIDGYLLVCLLCSHLGNWFVIDNFDIQVTHLKHGGFKKICFN